jgi:hypothetical protein
MTYCVSRQPARIAIALDSREVFALQREEDGQGAWVLYPVSDGVCGAMIDRSQHANDLIARVTQGLICAGHVASVDGGYVVPVPIEAGDFYISSFGYLCSRNPFRMVLSETPVSRYGIESSHQIRPATLEEQLSAGLDIADTARVAVFLMKKS